MSGKESDGKCYAALGISNNPEAQIATCEILSSIMFESGFESLPRDRIRQHIEQHMLGGGMTPFPKIIQDAYQANKERCQESLLVLMQHIQNLYIKLRKLKNTSGVASDNFTLIPNCTIVVRPQVHETRRRVVLQLSDIGTVRGPRYDSQSAFVSRDSLQFELIRQALQSEGLQETRGSFELIYVGHHPPDQPFHKGEYHVPTSAQNLDSIVFQAVNEHFKGVPLPGSLITKTPTIEFIVRASVPNQPTSGSTSLYSDDQLDDAVTFSDEEGTPPEGDEREFSPPNQQVPMASSPIEPHDKSMHGQQGGHAHEPRLVERIRWTFEIERYG